MALCLWKLLGDRVYEMAGPLTFQAWKWREVSLPKLQSDMCTLKLWDWSMKAPLSAAMSTSFRCLISHTVL